MLLTPILFSALLPQVALPASAGGEKVGDAGASMLEGTEVYRSGDGRSSIRLDTRLMIDGALYDMGNLELDGDPSLKLSSGTTLRQARFGIKGVAEEVWSYELDVDFANAEIDLNDAWIGRTFDSGQRVRFGQYKTPFSLQYATSSRYNTFLERSIVDALSPGRSIGLGTDIGGENWSLAGGLFGQRAADQNDGNDFENAGNEGYSAALRATYAPIYRDRSIVHLGASLQRGVPDAESDNSDGNSDVVRYRSRPETAISRLQFLDTGRITGVDWFNTYGVEAAMVHGSIRGQAEYIATHLERSGEPGSDFVNAGFSGYYAQIAWLITGEIPPYRPREGEFGRIVPTGPDGAWELAFRFSELDLDDSEADVTGGTSLQRTIGLNYYPNAYIKTMLNYSWITNGSNADANGDSNGDGSFSMLQFRIQFSL